MCPVVVVCGEEGWEEEPGGEGGEGVGVGGGGR